MLRTSPEQNSENCSPSSESERCKSFLDFDVKGIGMVLLRIAMITILLSEQKPGGSPRHPPA